MLSSATGYLFGVFVGFIINKGWTFQYQNITVKEPLQYITVYTFSLLLGLALLRLLVSKLNIPPEIANVATIALTTITNFSGLKFWVFRK
jgi:putative flippase GtrA